MVPSPPTSPRASLRACLRAAALACLAALPSAARPQDSGALALSLVNEARAERGLPALRPSERLARVAEGHAEDMLARDYYAHASPEGDTARDRFLEAGGGPGRLVAENLARCEGCEGPEAERLRGFQSGWMQSPGHRANILGEGLRRFGLGFASGDGTSYAVQMFAGPGTPPGAAPGEAPERVGREEAAAEALEAIDAARAEEGRPPLEPSADLDAVARAAAERATLSAGELELPSDTFGLLPEGAEGWTGLAVSAATCGGCGAYRARGDAAHFAGRLAAGGGEADTHLGFALSADGAGGKTAVAVYGRR